MRGNIIIQGKYVTRSLVFQTGNFNNTISKRYPIFVI